MDNEKQEKTLVSRRRKDKKAPPDRTSVSILIPGLRFPLRILLPPSNSYLSQSPLDEEETSSDTPQPSPLVDVNSLVDVSSSSSVTPSTSVDISHLINDCRQNNRATASGQVDKRSSKSGSRTKECALAEEISNQNVDNPHDKSNINSSSVTKIYIKSTCKPKDFIGGDIVSECPRNEDRTQEESKQISPITDPLISEQPLGHQTVTSSRSIENFVKDMISSVLDSETRTVTNNLEHRDEQVIKENSPIPLAGTSDLKETPNQSQPLKLVTFQDGPSKRNLVDASVLTVDYKTRIDQNDTCCQTDKSIDNHCISVQTGTVGSNSRHRSPIRPKERDSQRSKPQPQETLESKNLNVDKKLKNRRSYANGGKVSDKRRPMSANARDENAKEKDKREITIKEPKNENNANKQDEENEQSKKREKPNKGHVVKAKQSRCDLKHKKHCHISKSSSRDKLGVKAERSSDTEKVNRVRKKSVGPTKRKSNESIGIRIIHVNKNSDEYSVFDGSEAIQAVSLHDVGRTSEEKLCIKDLFSETLQQGATGIVIQDAVPQKTPKRPPEPVPNKSVCEKPQEAGCSKKEELHDEKPKVAEPHGRMTSNKKHNQRPSSNKRDTPGQDFNLAVEMKKILSAIWTLLYHIWITYL